jgi:hypothetical protein
MLTRFSQPFIILCRSAQYAYESGDLAQTTRLLGIVFFLVKGLLWLLVPALIALWQFN